MFPVSGVWRCDSCGAVRFGWFLHTPLSAPSHGRSLSCDAKPAWCSVCFSPRSGCKVRKVMTQSLALDGCSQVSLSLSSAYLLDSVPHEGGG